MALAVSLNILSLTLGEAFGFSAFLKIREMGAKKASSFPETYRIGGNVVNYQGLEVGEGLFLLEGLKGKSKRDIIKALLSVVQKRHV